MKVPFLFPALGFALFLTACQKEAPSLSDNSSDPFAPPPTERCGCTAPTESTIEKVTDASVGLSWSAVPEVAGYRVEVKNGKFDEEADGLTDIYTFETTDNERLAVANLIPGARYYYRVTSICGHFGGSQSESCNSMLDYFDTKESVHGDPGYNRPAPGKYGLPPVQ